MTVFTLLNNDDMVEGLCSCRWRGEWRRGHAMLAEIGGMARMQRIRGAGLTDAENGAIEAGGGGGGGGGGD